MSYNDKLLRKGRAEMQAKELLGSWEYKRNLEQSAANAATTAYSSLCLVTADYLQRHYHCKEQGIRNFVKHAEKSMEYINTDPEYLKLMNEAILDETGIDVLSEIGAEFVEEYGQRNVAIQAIADHFGADAQSKQLIEEMAELSKEISKYYWRGQTNRKDALAEEIADVQIMLWQLEYLLNVNAEPIVEKKLKRTLERIKAGFGKDGKNGRNNRRRDKKSPCKNQ